MHKLDELIEESLNHEVKQLQVHQAPR